MRRLGGGDNFEAGSIQESIRRVPMLKRRCYVAESNENGVIDTSFQTSMLTRNADLELPTDASLLQYHKVEALAGVGGAPGNVSFI